MATTSHTSPHGQNHDRFGHDDDELSMRNMLPTIEEYNGENSIADITPFQKMLSATTGSLLTSLTSMPSAESLTT